MYNLMATGACKTKKRTFTEIHSRKKDRSPRVILYQLKCFFDTSMKKLLAGCGWPTVVLIDPKALGITISTEEVSSRASILVIPELKMKMGC